MNINALLHVIVFTRPALVNQLSTNTTSSRMRCYVTYDKYISDWLKNKGRGEEFFKIFLKKVLFDYRMIQ